jgi:hypothetical protein
VRVSILGSCITRDVFRLFPGAAEVASYHSRSSLISLMSAPVEFDDTDVCWPSNFARKTVLADLKKTFFDDLQAAAPDVLIVDLMSERFDLLRGGETYVTRSWELIEASLHRRCGYRLERVPRETKAMRDAWLANADDFAARLKAHFPTLPVLLHRAFWTLEYRDGSTMRTFPRRWWGSIRERNEMLVDCYAELQRLLPGLSTIEASRSYVADARHRWGLGTSHYEHGYYDDVRNAMCSALGQRTAALAA